MDGTVGMLDTHALILMERLRVEDLPPEPVITVITLAELSVGPLVAADHDEGAARQARLQEAESVFEPLPFDAAAARAYGRIASSLRRAGRKTTARAFDALIAATAISNGLQLFTCNPQGLRRHHRPERGPDPASRSERVRSQPAGVSLASTVWRQYSALRSPKQLVRSRNGPPSGEGPVLTSFARRARQGDPRPARRVRFLRRGGLRLLASTSVFTTEECCAQDKVDDGTRISQRFRVLRAPKVLGVIYAMVIPTHRDRTAALIEDLTRLGTVATRSRPLA